MTKSDNDIAYAAEGRLLAAALDERRIGPSEFSRMLAREYGLTAGPQNCRDRRSDHNKSRTTRPSKSPMRPSVTQVATELPRNLLCSPRNQLKSN